MSALVVSFVFYVVLATAAKCDINLKQVPSHHKEISTTFLRLTALREDEGLWIARFGTYEISIELKHHFKSADRKDAEDTWTLKIKHVSKRYKVPRNEDEFYYKNEVDVDEQSSQRNKDLWEQTTQATYNDIKDVHKPMFIKFRRPGKVKRGKYRRKLSPRSQVTSESNVTATLDGTDTQLTLPEPPIFKELVQENQRLQVSFDRNGNDTSQMEKTDEAFQEFDETQWDNVAAVLLDSTANHTLPVDQQEDQEEVHATESSINQEHEKLMESYALPLKQYEDSDGFEAEENTTTLEETNEKEHNYNIERMKASGGVDINDYKERNSKHSTAGSDIAGIFDQEKRAVIESDYVIEDPTVREYDKEDVEDEEEYKYGNRQDDHGDYEPTSEMKRIMDWFPRSTLLTTENNGYKLFPGVGWFKLVTWPERWSRARKVCELEMAHLAVPDSRQKVRVFLQIFKNYPDVLEQTILHRQVYVGVYRSGQNKSFSTVLGKVFLPKFQIWFPNEPDNADPGEECVTFHAEGKIRDVPCFYNLPFLCEKGLEVS